MKHIKIAVLSLILFTGLTNPTVYSFDGVISFTLLAYAGLVVFKVSTLQRIIARIGKQIIIWPLIMAFLVTGWINSGELSRYLAVEPKTETYRTDMDDFLKTYYLMEKGQNYYFGFKLAVEQNAFKDRVSDNLWSWRLPVIFYVWKWLPGQNAILIYYLFLILTAASLLVGYKIAVEVTGERYAILSGYLLYPYFHFAARDQTMLQTEWWALLPMFLGIYFFSKKKFGRSVMAFTASVLIRELFIIPLIIMLVVNVMTRKRQWWVFGIPFAILVLTLFLHSRLVSQQVLKTSNFIAPRLSGGRDILLSTLAFGSWEYFFYWTRIFMILFGVGVIGVIKGIREARKIREVMLIFLSFYFYPLIFLFIGTSIYNDYWGIFYMPFVLVSVPFVLRKI